MAMHEINGENIIFKGKNITFNSKNITFNSKNVIKIAAKMCTLALAAKS